jgi:hypothetical protein
VANFRAVLMHVDAINAFGVFARRFASFRILSRRQFQRFRSSFLKERGRSRPPCWLFSLFCGLTRPGLGALNQASGSRLGHSPTAERP